MVVDMKAKKESREARMGAKREAIRSQAGLPETTSAAIPGTKDAKAPTE